MDTTGMIFVCEHGLKGDGQRPDCALCKFKSKLNSYRKLTPEIVIEVYQKFADELSSFYQEKRYRKL